ncbi:MAG: RNase adapter RapZ, partial [Thermodesulfovibrionales bacterium]
MKPRVIILTGLSGSGKTVALRAFEDCGYFCTDNLPPALIDEFIKISAAEGLNSIAIGVDIREKTFLAGIDSTISRLKSTYNFETVFLEAEIETLLRRFKETRRPHPLAGRGGDIRESIRSESSALQPLRDLSDRIVDTTSLSPHQLRDTIRTMFCSVRHDKMHVIITSFGYKFGIPSNADLVFDVRFLPNPHFVTELRELTGTDRPVKEFV